MGETIWHSKMVAFLVNEREKLVGYVRRLIEDAADRDGEDIVQDVTFNIFKKADVSEPIEHLTAYVYQSLHHRVTDYLRKRREALYDRHGDWKHYREFWREEGKSAFEAFMARMGKDSREKSNETQEG